MPEQYLKSAKCVEQLAFCNSKSEVHACNSVVQDHILFGGRQAQVSAGGPKMFGIRQKSHLL